MSWSLGNHGFDIGLSGMVPDVLEEHILKALALYDANQNTEGMDYLIHPGGKSILEACQKAIQISSADLQHSYNTLSNFGNMSSVTIFCVIKSWLEHKSSEKKALAMAFGPGLTVEALALQKPKS
jgi:predicted naringenin-chalcone synthase